MTTKSKYDSIITKLDESKLNWNYKYLSLVVCWLDSYYIWSNYSYKGVDSIYGDELYFDRDKMFLINCRYKNEVIPLNTKIILCTKYYDNLKLGENLKEFYYLGLSPFISNINLPIGLEGLALSKNLQKCIVDKIKIPYGCKLFFL